MSNCRHHDDCEVCGAGAPRGRRGGLLRLLLEVVILYALTVFAGGTLISTGHPVAVEIGRIIHIVTLHDRTVGWAEDAGYERLAGGLRVLGEGVDLS